MLRFRSSTPAGKTATNWRILKSLVWRRDLLRHAMEAEGFTVYEAEWWHFDYKDWRKYPILNLSFEQIEADKNKMN